MARINCMGRGHDSDIVSLVWSAVAAEQEITGLTVQKWNSAGAAEVRLRVLFDEING
jgi:hypothetical protein